MKETYQSTVKHRINGDLNHGWGIDDSMAVILALIKKETGKELTEECQAMVKSVVNPSVCKTRLACERDIKREDCERVYEVQCGLKQLSLQAKA